MKDYYKILGIDKKSSSEDIKRAYRKLASLHHPDKGGDTAQFQEIQEAYATLSDINKRQQYDNPKPQFNFAGDGPGFNFEEIFNIFGADLRGQRNTSSRLSLWISLVDVMTGGTRNLSIQTNKGASNISINIPKGINDGDNVRYPGLAPDGQDLIINYRIKPDPKWRYEGLNLISESTVDIWDLILGSDLSVTDVVGNTYSISIPPETQPDAILRVKGHGLPARSLPGDRAYAPAGDLLIKLHTRITSPVHPDIIEAIRKSRDQ